MQIGSPKILDGDRGGVGCTRGTGSKYLLVEKEEQVAQCLCIFVLVLVLFLFLFLFFFFYGTSSSRSWNRLGRKKSHWRSLNCPPLSPPIAQEWRDVPPPNLDTVWYLISVLDTMGKTLQVQEQGGRMWGGIIRSRLFFCCRLPGFKDLCG